jgi:hypothetical protein
MLSLQKSNCDFLRLSSAFFAKVELLQQSFCPNEHFFEVVSLFCSLSLQGFALPKTAISTNLLQQKCISTVKDEVAKTTTKANATDTILVKKRFTF